MRKLRTSGEQGPSGGGRLRFAGGTASCDACADVPEPAPIRSQPGRRLHVLRHAKSSWEDTTLPDRARPLSPRGKRAAEQIRRWLHESDVRPDLVLCSPAVRARDTLERVLPALGAPHVLVEPALYHAAAETLLERVRALPDDVGEALLVGHNPGLEGLVWLLAAPLADAEQPERLPTGALATLAAEGCSWPELRPGSMTLTGLVLPRRLG